MRHTAFPSIPTAAEVARIPVAQSERPHSGDHRSERTGRKSDRPLRIRRDSDLSCKKRPASSSGGCGPPLRDAVLVCSRWAASDRVRAVRPFLQICRRPSRQQPLSGSALSRRSEASSRRPRSGARGPSMADGGRNHHRRHRDLSLGEGAAKFYGAPSVLDYKSFPERHGLGGRRWHAPRQKGHGDPAQGVVFRAGASVRRLTGCRPGDSDGQRRLRRMEQVSGRLVVVGGGQAAFALVAKLRALKDMRPITSLPPKRACPTSGRRSPRNILLREMTLDRLLCTAGALVCGARDRHSLSTAATAIDRGRQTRDAQRWLQTCL